jgi:hypothetical protein
MNSRYNAHEARNALELPSKVAPSTLQVLGRAAVLVVAVALVALAAVAVASAVPAVAVLLGMLAAVAVVGGVVALPFVVVQAVGDAL